MNDLASIRAAIDKNNSATIAALNAGNAAISKLDQRLDAIEARQNRTAALGGIGGSEADRTTALARTAFAAYLRAGDDRIQPEFKAALTVGDDTTGGYLAPGDFQRDLEKNLVEFSPVREAARVGTTSAGEVLLPKRTAGPTGYWVGETEDRQATQPAYGLDRFPVGEIAAYTDVSLRMLEDSAFDVAAELSMDFAEAFGAVEGAAFIAGDSVQKPEGVMVAAGVPEVVTGHATTVTADSLRTALYALPQAYRRNAVWMMNSTTLGNVSKLKDGSGQYLWVPGLREGETDRLLGRQVVEAIDMPDEGAGAFPIIIGDFSRYRIFDKGGVQILRDPFSQATKGLVRFHARRRVGAGVRLAAAFRKLKCAAS